MSRRQAGAAALVGLLAAAAVLASGLLLYGWQPGRVAQYALTDGLGNLLDVASLACGAAVLLLLVPLPYGAYAVSACTALSPVLAAIVLEMLEAPSSHDLLPFELASWAIGGVVLHLPSLLVKVVRERLRARGTSA